MLLTMLKGKVHRATVTDVDIDYEGSILVDEALMRASGIIHNEQVDVYNITNGQRFTTYAKPAKKGSGDIRVLGAAAHLVNKGDLVIICAYCIVTKKESIKHKPKVVMVNGKNQQVKEATVVKTPSKLSAKAAVKSGGLKAGTVKKAKALKGKAKGKK
jgi:aspartate 1-decarboxylase